ncbi:MAG: hypothetical protein QNJ88_16680 [Acidimicrobiia bacterium]|nr:hypothetical protein [Acidimicrobiia bacterium]
MRIARMVGVALAGALGAITIAGVGLVIGAAIWLELFLECDDPVAAFSGCSKSENPFLIAWFILTAAVLMIAVLLIESVFIRRLVSWARELEPQRDGRRLGKPIAVSCVAVLLLVVIGSALGGALPKMNRGDSEGADRTTTAGPIVRHPTTRTPVTAALPDVAASTTQPTRLAWLRADGLGPVDFGAPTDVAIVELAAELGPPDRSTTRFFTFYSWDAYGLTVAFDDYKFHRNDGVEHLVGWSLFGEASPLTTAGGVGLGSRLEDVRRENGGAPTSPIADEECMPPWYVWVRAPVGDGQVLAGFDAPPDESGRINLLQAGASEGC